MDNIYTQDRESSAELLRLILQQMPAHPAPFNPHVYAVWYEHLAGINPPLAMAMTKLLAGEGKLTDTLAQELFDRHISEGNQEAQQAFRLNMQRLLANLSKFAEMTGAHTDHFSADLKKYGETLSRSMDQPALKEMIKAIADDTDAMRGSVSTLQGKLQESKGEVEKLQKELESAKSEALLDPMTKVFNRRGFDAQMKKIAATPELRDRQLSLLMLDIDFFKKVNDTYGHLFGDKVICGLASVLTAQVKGQDSVARLGGEEFAVILPDTPVKGAYAVAENIRKRVEAAKIKRIDRQEFVGGITVSIGIAECPAGGDWNSSLGHADKALYASKQGGRNRTTLYGETLLAV